jgi:hypothetical protein
MASHQEYVPRTVAATDEAGGAHANGAGIFAAPSFYGPAGGLSGRSTLAVVVWVAAWIWFHRRWRGRELEARTVYLSTFVLAALGLLATLPPVWGLL